MPKNSFGNSYERPKKQAIKKFTNGLTNNLWKYNDRIFMSSNINNINI